MRDEKSHKESGHQDWPERGTKAFDQLMNQILELGQSSLPEHQFKAFRNMTIRFFMDGKKYISNTCPSEANGGRTVTIRG